jgi:hypothetical protein
MMITLGLEHAGDNWVPKAIAAVVFLIGWSAFQISVRDRSEETKKSYRNGYEEGREVQRRLVESR